MQRPVVQTPMDDFFLMLSPAVAAHIQIHKPLRVLTSVLSLPLHEAQHAFIERLLAVVNRNLPSTIRCFLQYSLHTTAWHLCIVNRKIDYPCKRIGCMIRVTSFITSKLGHLLNSSAVLVPALDADLHTRLTWAIDMLFEDELLPYDEHLIMDTYIKGCTSTKPVSVVEWPEPSLPGLDRTWRPTEDPPVTSGSSSESTSYRSEARLSLHEELLLEPLDRS
jgi:hypothetical protein